MVCIWPLAPLPAKCCGFGPATLAIPWRMVWIFQYCFIYTRRFQLWAGWGSDCGTGAKIQTTVIQFGLSYQSQYTDYPIHYTRNLRKKNKYRHGSKCENWSQLNIQTMGDKLQYSSSLFLLWQATLNAVRRAVKTILVKYLQKYRNIRKFGISDYRAIPYQNCLFSGVELETFADSGCGYRIMR
jgi:hypothetical protein